MKLLVVEDEFEINDLISHFFKSEGFVVESAYGLLWRLRIVFLQFLCDFLVDSLAVSM